MIVVGTTSTTLVVLDVRKARSAIAPGFGGLAGSEDLEKDQQQMLLVVRCRPGSWGAGPQCEKVAPPSLHWWWLMRERNGARDLANWELGWP